MWAIGWFVQPNVVMAAAASTLHHLAMARLPGVVCRHICGLVVAILGWLSGGMSFGSGYGITSQVIASDVVLPWHAPSPDS